ncbi:hypothetical protein MNV49_003607 [Pseudohyphozyma bogoriensis]|nr:hypothetical protein MNV49_003607 [Pseudohyphozyma bogoriensis]
MAELTHPNIVGQAMTLRVKKILHVEKSLYQDVLVFESTDHGNVLVLDGAIQCVERDEFSYQEMIAHLPLASHPNPVNVLVIGGGDGGVLREVLKHPSVKSATLCDIDEAVPRVSKLYLPHMAKGYDDERVTLFIGDGFKFLEENKAKFDVIITDSSDPVGPANSLFQKPYFQLLKESLAPGGSISTQGECIWLHLPLINDLMSMSRSLFPKAEFAYTSIPTYPSGTIGFVVATLDGQRDLRTPLREIPNTRYWNPTIHRAAFQLPTFAQNVVDESLKTVVAPSGKPAKKVLLLGSGFVAQPAADYILRRTENSLTIACRNVKTAEALAAQLARPASAISVDVSDEASLDAAVKEHDLVISLIPYTFHAAVIKSAIKFKKNVVTTSYVSDAMKALEPEVIKAGITVLNEVGLDPGIDHLYAVKTIDEVHQAGGKITGFLSYCGGLPAPESADNPLGYKFSWSSRGVLLALLNSGRLYQDGQLVEIDGKDLMGHAKPYFISPAFATVCYPNRDSTTFREKYNIPEAGTVVRGTLRFQGFPAFIKALVELGFLNESPKDYLTASSTLTWNEVTAKAIGAKDASEASLLERVKALVNFENASEEQRITSGLRWIGLFSAEKITPRGNLLDTLCATLEAKMQYEKGERDMVILQHKFEIENKDGSKEVRTSTLLDFGAPVGSAGPSSMAKLVGVPCGIAVQLVLDGVIAKHGVLAPYTRDIVDPILAEVEKEGITLVEKTL